MKYNIKQFIGALILITLIAPQVMFAETTSTSKIKADKFCENLSTFQTNSENKVVAKNAEKNLKLANREAEIATKRAEKDKKVADLQAKALAKQEVNFAKVLSKATTIEQKTAINEFIASVKIALSVRQTAMNAARDAYRSGADNIIAERKTKIETALSLRKSTIATAVAKAKADCAAGVASATVKTTLQSSIKSANDAFKNTIQNLGKVGDQLNGLIDARKISFEKAKNDFKNTLESLKVTLKTKLGNK